ncbi:MAG TPA: hypothetical protein VMN60_01585 [Longimicrobiales bacterium]|nr:hypothetical protein [Longimicrobiales bacterium]
MSAAVRAAMRQPMNAARMLRWLAVAIAIAALLDPAVTTRRRVNAVVAIVSDAQRDHALADRVERELGRFTTVRAPLATAAATVFVGSNLPATAAGSGGPAFAVVPDIRRPAVTLAAVHAPARAPLHARVPVVAVLDVTDATGRSVEVSLLTHDDVVLDRASVTITDPDTRLSVPLWFVPAARGTARLRVHAAPGNSSVASRADVAIDVRDAHWSVLFYDARPSWLSTFVRRTLEHDARFVVTSRTITSRDVATEFGTAPRRLDDDRALAAFDVIAIGAPEALTDSDVAGLERFLRGRGGGVALLLDRAVGGAYERLAGVRDWTGTTGTMLELTAVGATPGLRASQVVWPVRMPPLASTLAARSNGNAAAVPIVWRVPVGAGRIVVSGALDAWRFRDADVSGFDTFWPALIADLADAAPPALDVTLSDVVATPGAWIDLRITLRDAALAGLDGGQTARGAFAAALVSPVRDGTTTALAAPGAAAAASDSSSLRLLPSHDAGTVRARFRAPERPGLYTVSASGDGARGYATFVVDHDVAHATRDERELLRAWTASRGGRTLAASELHELADHIESTIRAVRRASIWHPMRSAWWIVPFALALGGEWYIRRRRGLR